MHASLARETFRGSGDARAPSGLLLRLAPWAPTSPRLFFGIALLLIAPAVGARVAFGETAFQSLWVVVDDGGLRTLWDRISPSGALLLAAAGFGVLLLVFLFATTYAARYLAGASVRARPIGVFPTRVPAGSRRAFVGVARRATVEVTGPVAGSTPSLFFGVWGLVDGAELADAEGGDFDLELASGERMMVSLEHALLEADAVEGAPAFAFTEVALDDEVFDAFVASRGLRRRARACTITACAVHEGDSVVVEADVAGAALVAGGAFRAPAARARVLSGTSVAPLVVRVTSSGSASSRTPDRDHD